MQIDIKERVRLLQNLLRKISPTKPNIIKLVGYDIMTPQKSKLKNRTHYLIKPPFSYNKRKKYNFKYNKSYLDLFKINNYYSLFNIINLKSTGNDFINESLIEMIKEFSCTIYYTYAYLWIRTIIESLIKRNHKIKIIESESEFNPIVFYPLLSDLESEDFDLIINLSWYPQKCEIKNNVLNLSIFNNIRN